MNILFLNNYSYLRGGAENVFIAEADLLQRKGNNAYFYSVQHPNNMRSKYEKFFPRQMITESLRPSINSFRSLCQLFYNQDAKMGLANMLEDISFDVAHAHNIYGGLTTSVLDLLHKRNVPILLTLHDYKLICPNYKLLAKKKICEDCKGGKYYMAVRNACHKESRVASTIYALETYFNEFFHKYRKNIRFLIAPSHFIKAKFIEFDWPEEHIEYIPNFITLSKFDPLFTPGNYFLYLGRLSSEKGILTLINAFTNLKSVNLKLLILGEGPIRGQLEDIAKSDSRIFFKGHLSEGNLKETVRNALAVIIPSEWYENAPMSILESFAHGKPVIGSRIGGIPELIDDGINGFLFDPGNVEDLKDKIELVLSMSGIKLINMGKEGRQKVEKYYNAKFHYERLIDIYHRVRL